MVQRQPSGSYYGSSVWWIFIGLLLGSNHRLEDGHCISMEGDDSSITWRVKTTSFNILEGVNPKTLKHFVCSKFLFLELNDVRNRASKVGDGIVGGKLEV